jgi:hypothetical protein
MFSQQFLSLIENREILLEHLNRSLSIKLSDCKKRKGDGSYSIEYDSKGTHFIKG